MRIFTLVFFTIIAVEGFANNPDSIFQNANQAYQSNDFEKAIELYNSVLEDGYESAELEYNLGNAYFRTNQLGRAILHFERALLLSPTDADILYNLNVANSNVETVEALPEFFLTAWWKGARSKLPATSWGIFALFLTWCSLASFCLWLFGKKREQKKVGFFAGLGLLAASALVYALAFNKMAVEKSSGMAIVLQKNTELNSAPDEAGTEIMSLPEGIKVELIEKLGGWVQVNLPNGEKGWVAEEDIEEI